MVGSIISKNGLKPNVSWPKLQFKILERVFKTKVFRKLAMSLEEQQNVDLTKVENSLYMKARNKDEYLSLVSSFIVQINATSNFINLANQNWKCKQRILFPGENTIVSAENN